MSENKKIEDDTQSRMRRTKILRKRRVKPVDKNKEDETKKEEEEKNKECLKSLMREKIDGMKKDRRRGNEVTRDTYNPDW